MNLTEAEIRFIQQALADSHLNIQQGFNKLIVDMREEVKKQQEEMLKQQQAAMRKPEQEPLKMLNEPEKSKKGDK